MAETRASAWARRPHHRLLEVGPDNLRLLSEVARLLARGHPLTTAQVERLAAGLGIDPAAAGEFVWQMTEQDAADQIVGAMDLSLGNHPHRLSVDGVSLSAWCALDTLFLPAILGQTATIVSPSPVSGQAIRLRVSPERVEEVSPASAVISLVIADLRREDMASVAAIGSACCTHTHFFALREEGERWASARDDIAIVTVDEGFKLGRQMWSEILSSAETGKRG